MPVQQQKKHAAAVASSRQARPRSGELLNRSSGSKKLAQRDSLRNLNLEQTYFLP